MDRASRAAARMQHGAVQAPQTRARRIKKVPGNASFPGQSVAGFIPIPFDPNRSRPSVSASLRRDEPQFTKAGKPLRKIRQDGLPVLAVKFAGPWSLLAEVNVESQASLSASPWQFSPEAKIGGGGENRTPVLNEWPYSLYMFS